MEDLQLQIQEKDEFIERLRNGEHHEVNFSECFLQFIEKCLGLKPFRSYKHKGMLELGFCI